VTNTQAVEGATAEATPPRSPWTVASAPRAGPRATAVSALEVPQAEEGVAQARASQMALIKTVKQLQTSQQAQNSNASTAAVIDHLCFMRVGILIIVDS